MLKIFTFFLAVFSTILHANSKDFSYVYKTGVAPSTKLTTSTYTDSKGKWYVDMEENVAYYHPSPDKNIKFIYSPLDKKAYVLNGNSKTTCSETKIGSSIICKVNDIDYFNLSKENLQLASNNIRKVVSGSHYWKLWDDADAYTVVYTQNKNLTFDKATMRFFVSGFECNAMVNGKPWIYVTQLKYDRESIDKYHWNIVDKNDAILYCGGVRAKLSGFYDRVKNLDNRSEFAKKENLNY